MTKNICIVAGARPNFIKVAPILHAINNARKEGRDICCNLVYTGREDDPTIEPSLFESLQMNRPDTYLGANDENLNELTGHVMAAFSAYLSAHKTDAVIVVDDLASTMASAIVTKKQGILLAHLVAGTRSFDINMPKEINRLVIDGLSDLLFTAGTGSNSAVTREGAEQSKVYMVGNILMDTLRLNHSRLRRSEVFDRLGLKAGEYIVFTLNRKVLIENKANLKDMLVAMNDNSAGHPIIAPLRPSAESVVKAIEKEFGLNMNALHIINPMQYLEFGYLAAHALGIVTDSGNVAEEATFNNVPCITLNSYTEHIETVKQGTNVLVGEDASRLSQQMQLMTAGRWKKGGIPDRWDGRSAERIVCILEETIDRNVRQKQGKDKQTI